MRAEAYTVPARIPSEVLCQAIGTICAVSCVHGSCDEQPQSDGKTWCERNGECIDAPDSPPSSEIMSDQLQHDLLQPAAI